MDTVNKLHRETLATQIGSRCFLLGALPFSTCALLLPDTATHVHPSSALGHPYPTYLPVPQGHSWPVPEPVTLHWTPVLW